MNKRWLTKPLPAPNPAFKPDCVVSKLLMQRGIQSPVEANAFFNPDLKGLHDPFLMKDLGEAVDRVNQAMENGEKILLFGDYDVDGTTAVAKCLLTAGTSSDPVNNGEAVLLGLLNGSQPISIRELTNKIAIDFSSNRYKWTLTDDSTETLLILTAM